MYNDFLNDLHLGQGYDNYKQERIKNMITWKKVLFY